jgi:uncharacterized membrane protein YoaK (UPF0700 family)
MDGQPTGPQDLERTRTLSAALAHVWPLLAFTGALTGSVASLAWGVHAIWMPAGFLAITLCVFIVDERHLR